MDTYTKDEWKSSNKMDYLKSKYTALLLILAGFVIFFGAGAYLMSENPRSRSYYLQGTTFLKDKKYQDAFYNFSKVKSGSKLYLAALYRQAYCAEKLDDTKTAFEKYNLIKNKYAESVFSPKAVYEAAKYNFQNGELSKSKQQFEKLKQDYKDSLYAVGADYYLGLIHKNSDLRLAKKYWLNYLDKCPNCIYSDNCINELLLTENLTPAENDKIAVSYYNRDNYGLTVEFINRGNMNEAWDYYYLSQSKLTQKPAAKEIFDEGFTKYSNHIDSKKLNEVIDYYLNSQTRPRKEVLEELYATSTQYHTRGRDFLLFNLANISEKVQKINYFTKLVNEYPKSDFASISLWEVFRYYCRQGQLENAIILGQKHLSLYPDTLSTPAVLFWMGKIYHKKGDSRTAGYYYKKVQSDYSDDYYAFRAAAMYRSGHLNWHKNQTNNPKKLIPGSEISAFPFQYSGFNEQDMQTIDAAMALGDYDILDNIEIENKIVKSWILYKNKKYSTSVLQAREALKELKPKPPFNSIIYKLAYPILFPEEITKYSSMLNLDSYLMISLIREESYFNTEARSVSDAKGLMQLMPSTAQYIANKKEIAFTSSKDLYNPEYNIKLGCNYFDYVRNKLRNSNLLAVAAYNGGPNAVDSWLNNTEYSDFDVFVEDIPYNETRNYVKKVYRSYWNYINIYD